jgi:hypothetical protein
MQRLIRITVTISCGCLNREALQNKRCHTQRGESYRHGACDNQAEAQRIVGVAQVENFAEHSPNVERVGQAKKPS